MPRKATGKGGDPKTGACPGVRKTEEDWKLFLQVLADTANVSRSAEVAKINRCACYDKKESDPEFCAAWEKAYARGYDHLEELAQARAFEGVRKPVFFQGSRVYETDFDEVYDRELKKMVRVERLRLDAEGQRIPVDVREFSDALTTFLLRGRKSEVFKDRSEVVTKDGGAARPHGALTIEELRAKLKKARGE